MLNDFYISLQSAYYNEKLSTGYIQTRLNSLREKLTPSKKKNNIVVVQRKPRKVVPKKGVPAPPKSPKVSKTDRAAKVLLVLIFTSVLNVFTFAHT